MGKWSETLQIFKRQFKLITNFLFIEFMLSIVLGSPANVPLAGSALLRAHFHRRLSKGYANFANLQFVNSPHCQNCSISRELNFRIRNSSLSISRSFLVHPSSLLDTIVTPIRCKRERNARYPPSSK